MACRQSEFPSQGVTQRGLRCGLSCAGTAPTATATPGPAPTVAPPPPFATPPESAAAAKTAKACTEEWRADKANFQAKGITERAYVAACRAGTVATPTIAPAPAPTTTTTAAPPPPAPAPAPTASRPTAEPPFGTTQRAPSTGSPSATGQYATEAQAKASCLGDTVVSVNLRSKIYHFAGTHNYGNTMNGAYMCESRYRCTRNARCKERTAFEDHVEQHASGVVAPLPFSIGPWRGAEKQGITFAHTI